MVGLDLRRAVTLAHSHLSAIEPRWTHVRAVGGRVESLCRSENLPADLAVAAWLHDVGYAREAVETGFHALDGARLLARLGASELVVSLVAYHSGAVFEAEERGLSGELAHIRPPASELLDVLVWVDMTTSPDGHTVSVEERLAEIVERYAPGDPVARAIARSATSLREAACRAADRRSGPFSYGVSSEDGCKQRHDDGP